MVLAPEHPLVERLAALGLPQEAALREYVDKAARTSDLDRTIAKTKTGVFTGVDVKHPLTGEQVPIWLTLTLAPTLTLTLTLTLTRCPYGWPTTCWRATAPAL